MADILNIEIKAKASDPAKIREYLIGWGAYYKGEDHQIDTYFNCPNGRLKLRAGNIENSLIFYNRQNQKGPKQSDIALERLSAENSIEEVLTKAYGVKVVVDKKRHIYFIDNVKFHVDEVVDLGTFVEIEAIDETGTIGIEKLKDQCDHYMKLLDIKEEDLAEISYSDLLCGDN